jgi:hypothetical protein
VIEDMQRLSTELTGTAGRHEPAPPNQPALAPEPDHEAEPARAAE